LKLTGKQERFCEEYLVDSNAAGAAVRAGYAKRSAKEIGCENLTKHNIMLKITQLRSDQTVRVKVDSEWVLTKAIELHDLCIEAKQYSTATRVLDTVGKHVNIQAFSEKQVVEHTGNISHDTTAMGNDILSALFERRRDEQERSKSVH